MIFTEAAGTNMARILDDLKMNYRSGGPETKVIYVNVAVFVLSLIFFFKFKAGGFVYPDWLALSSNASISLLRPWTFITYSFLHAGFLHLLFNMIVLNFSGSLFRTFFNAKQFIGLYILSAIFAGAVFVLIYYLMGIQSQIVGASASIMAILGAVATYSPNMKVRLMFLGEVKLWVLTSVLLGFDVFYVLIENTGGHISHLAGALFGFSYIKALQSGIEISTPVTWIMDKFANGFNLNNKHQFKKVHRNPRPIPNSSKQAGKDKTQQQIDEILDKISKSGYDSLSTQERDFLFRAGKQ